MRKVEDIREARRDTPEQEAIRAITNRAYSHSTLAQSRSVLVVEIMNGGEVFADMFVEGQDKGNVLLALKRLEARLTAED